MEKPIPPKTLINAIQEGKNFLLFGHIHPDSDCLSSQISLAKALMDLGKSVQLMGDIENSRHHLMSQAPFSQTIPEGWNPSNTHAIVMDCHSIERVSLGELIEEFPVLIVDHHQIHNPIDGVQWIVSQSPATAYLTFLLIKALGVTLTPEMGELLFQGVAADTGFFRFLGPYTGDLFSMAAQCVDNGVNPHEIYHNIYGGKNIRSPQFVASVLQRMEIFAEGQLIITYETEDDLATYGEENRGSAEVYDLLLGVGSCEGAIYLKRTSEGGTIAGLRSKSFLNMSEIAKLFGGGGHIRASGFRSSKSPEEIKKALIPVLEQHLWESRP